jgi:hypothetical protein
VDNEMLPEDFNDDLNDDDDLIDSVRENTPEGKEITAAEKIKRKIIPLPFLIKKTATEIKHVSIFAIIRT